MTTRNVVYLEAQSSERPAGLACALSPRPLLPSAKLILASDQHQVIAVHRLGSVVVAQDDGDLGRLGAADRQQLLRAVVGDAAGDALALPASSISTVSPRSKSPQTSLTPAGSRLVLRSRSAFAAPSSTTTLPGSKGRRGSSACGSPGGRRRPGSSVPIASPCARRGSTSGSRPLAITTSVPPAVARRAAWSFVTMPPVPCRSLAAGVALHRRVDALDAPDQRRVRVDRRVGGEEALARHQQRQQVGVDQVGGQRRQRVVLADAALCQLLDGHRVVLVDDRHHAVVQQRQQRVARVEVAEAVGEVAAGEQRLRHDDAVLGEQRGRRPASAGPGPPRPAPGETGCRAGCA